MAEYETLRCRRSAARVVLLPTDCLADETAAFDLLVEGVYAGHWAEADIGRAAVAWLGGAFVETEPCGGEGERVIAQVRPTIPAPLLGLEETPTLPQHDVGIVEAAILEVAVELHPEQLSTDGLLRQIVANPLDGREVETGVQAIRNLREVGLFVEREDEVVEPTPAALRAVARLT
ncbi:MAG TPA: hypothetical protein VHQ43_06790 [Solirubrobacterales bacterium]|jgi:hypothetical protein|nr:hypothetical protein [Solirubrobacterales bacterium]